MAAKKTRTTKTQKKRSSSKWHKRWQKNVLFAVVILAIITLVGFTSGWLGYEIGSTTVDHQVKESEVKQELKTAQQQIQNLRDRLAELENGSKVSFEREDTVVKFLTETGDYGKVDDLPPPKPATPVVSDKPFVAIIIDDVAYEHHMKQIESLSIPVTPSIFPPSSEFRTTPRMAANASNYMIHLPMEARSHPLYALPDTLTTQWTQAQIDNYIAKVRRWFPDALFINNHTGSAFTEDSEAMDRLYRSMQQHGFKFIDSRTTAQTTVPQIAQKYNQAYKRRDVFLDNKLDSDYIIGQIKETIKIAKENGSAMAIGHPHQITLDTLEKTNGLFNGVDVVYIDEYIQRLYGQ